MTFIIFTCNFNQVMEEDMMRCSKKRESILEIIKDIYGHPTVDSIYPQARLINL
jgi:Fe2+ or Zn2+ uptake regulation protein